MREPATWDFVEYSRHDVYGRFLTGWNYQTSGGEQVVNALKGLNLGLGLMTILGGDMRQAGPMQAPYGWRQ